MLSLKELEALYRQYRRPLVFAVLPLVGEAGAEDVVQEVFIELWEARRRLSSDVVSKAYLFRSVRNRALNRLRSVRREEARVIEFARQDRPESDPLEALCEAELAQEVAAAIERLPPRCRETFRLHRQCGLTYQETAEALGVSFATVKAQVGRALAAIRQALGDWSVSR